jgi:large subunit ribosomal protein L23
MELTTIIKKPIISEKSHRLIKEFNGYTFQVAQKATKGEIKKAVETLFGVKVLAVKIVNIGLKKKRTGKLRRITQISGIKKAIVILSRGEKISLFEFEKEK